MQGLAFIAVEVSVVASGLSGFMLWRHRKLRGRKRALEDKFIASYVDALESASKALHEQEQALERLRHSARELGLDREAAFADTLAEVQSAVTLVRGKHSAVAASSDSPLVNFETFGRIRGECDMNWGRITQIVLDMFSRPIRLLRELSEMEQQRQSKLQSATRRIAELERQVGNSVRSASRNGSSSSADLTKSFESAAQQMEERWGHVLDDCRRSDEAHQRTVSTMGRDLEHLEGINQRLTTLMRNLRQRQQAVAKRLQELKGLAEMTPRLKEELAQLTTENQALQNEIRELEDSRSGVEQQLQALKAELEALKSEPPRSALAEAQATQDRQVLQLLRDQNQRLILELEEVHEENEAMKKEIQQGKAGHHETIQTRLRQLESENTQLLAECEQMQKGMEEKEKENRRLSNKLRELGIVSAPR